LEANTESIACDEVSGLVRVIIVLQLSLRIKGGYPSMYSSCNRTHHQSVPSHISYAVIRQFSPSKSARSDEA
jgi:hypothetical protein